jgi:restriction endonuclease S subunit
MFADGHVTIIRDSAQRFEPRYLFYVLSIQQEHITVECAEGATNQIELSRHRLGNKYIDWPSIENQRQVVVFLDQGTGTLDKLIVGKKHLLDLLAEKRRVLAAHAVTQGLNSDVCPRAAAR